MTRRRPWGSITTVKRGKKYVLRWVQNTPAGRMRKTETFYGTYAQADERLNRIRYEVAAPPTMSVGELWRAYACPQLMEDVETGKRSLATARAYRSAWRSHVSPKWAGVPSTEVKPIDIQQWLSTMPKATGKMALNVLRTALSYAELYEFIPSNPAAKHYRFGDDTARAKSVYTDEELELVGVALVGTVAEAPFILCAYAGLRVGEACGMPLANVKHRDGYMTLEVAEQLSCDSGAGAKLKTKRSTRTVALVGAPAERLADIVRALPSNSAYVNDSGLGEPVPRSTVRTTYKDAIERAGLRYLPMQALRPAYETRMHWAVGLPIEKVARIMGHTGTATTLSHYDRPDSDELVRAIVGSVGINKDIQ